MATPASQRSIRIWISNRTGDPVDALQKVGCNKIFQDKITGISTSRPALDTMLAQLRSGDTVMTAAAVARFFRLGRSRDHLISMLGEFAERAFASRRWI